MNKLVKFSTVSALWKHIKEYPVEGATLEAFFVKQDDGIDMAMNSFELDTLTDQQYKAIATIIYNESQKSLKKRGLPNVLTVFRSGSISSEIVSVSLSETAARFFGTPVMYTIPRKKVLVDVNSIKKSRQQFVLEEELMVYSKDLKKS